MRLSGVANTTISGLSEGMMWDFKDKKPASSCSTISDSPRM